MSEESMIHKYVLKHKRLLELELTSEQDETKTTNNKEEEEGRSTRILRDLEVEHLGVGLLGRTVVQFAATEDINIGKNESIKQKKNSSSHLLPAHRLTVGDEVEIITKLSQANQGGASSSKRNKSGVISEVTDTSISVALFENNNHEGSESKKSNGDDEALDGSGWILVPRSSVQVHQKLIKALDALGKHGVNHNPAGGVVRSYFRSESDRSKPIKNERHSCATDDGFTFFNPNLDDSQKDAVRFALNSSLPISLIHGPPGTGKTLTVAELIYQAVHKHKMRVLVTAPSNVAVDNVLERLVSIQETIINQIDKRKRGKGSDAKNQKLRAVRIGHPARIQKSILHYSLESLVQNADGTEIVNDIRSAMKSHLDEASDPKTRGLERRAAYREIKILRKEIREREEKVVQSLLGNAQVVLSTNIGAGSYALDKFEKSSGGKPFDLVIIDEAAQALEASCWIPIFRGKRVVLAGDHWQLPPTVKSRHGEVQRELSRTMFERVMAMGNVSRMLQVQYRMHHDIAQWSSNAIYGGKLLSHDSVKARKLKHLPHILVGDEGHHDDESLTPITRDATLLLVDTSGCELYEATNGAGSRYNEGEADIVSKHVRTLINIGMKPQDIAVITPYNGQVEILRRLLLEDYPKLEIRSVDGFQGGEREAVVLSLVRSSDRGKDGIGFLSDKRRLNVAVTRAKRQCAVICDCDTVSQNSFLKGLVDWMEEHGEFLSAIEYLEDDALVSQENLPSSLLVEIKEDAKDSKATQMEDKKLSVDNKRANGEANTMASLQIASAVEICTPKQREKFAGQLEALTERCQFFAEIADEGEEMEMIIAAAGPVLNKLDVLCDELKLQYRINGTCAEGVEITVVNTEVKMESDALESNLAKLSIQSEMPLSHDRIGDNESLEEKDEREIPSEEDEKAKFGMKAASISTNAAPKKNETDFSEKGTEADAKISMNSILGSLAKERAARAQKEAPGQKPKKSKKKKQKRLGGSKVNEKKPKDTHMDDLDDLAFLDAQIEKVQTSHGRKINGTGNNYRTIVNGILISKPKPQEKKRDPRVANALSAKLKQAQQSRRSKTKKK